MMWERSPRSAHNRVSPLKMTGAGVAISLVAAALLTRFLGTLLFAVRVDLAVTLRQE